ncbi:MAG: alpha/beta hydrolase family esterase, partial [bacterium]
LNKTADKEGFIVVYPNGIGRVARMLTFNAGNCCAYAMTNDIDDVAFTRKLLDDIENAVNVDKKRVYATGMSNGAIMCYRLAAELSSRIAAIAPVSGPVGQASVNPGRAVPVIHFHGTADDFAPFEGGKGKGLSGTDFYSVDYSLKLWVKANGCHAEPVVVKMADKSKDGTSITRKTFGHGRDGAEVVLIEIQGGGHTWPGQAPRMQSLGKSTKNISANEVMWEFFEKHPLK